MFNFSLDYLSLRHGSAAQWIRAGLSQWLLGRDGWPLVFRPPGTDEGFPNESSSNLYIHLPFCRQICPHCPYNRALLKPELVTPYWEALEREMDDRLKRTKQTKVNTLYFGGGSPSQTPELIERVLAKFKNMLSNETEIGVEVHPYDASPALLERLREAGVNRISLGIETLRPDLLRMLARRYTPEQALESIRLAREVGFTMVDVNLIHGIPGQLVSDAEEDARQCMSIGVDQISAYPLFSFAHTPLGQNNKLRSFGELDRLRAQRAVSRVCREGGLERSSVWSFTRPGLSPYSTVTHEDYLGFGAGAGSKVNGVFWFNTFSVAEYTACTPHRSALVMRSSERLRRLHWLYWSIYQTRIEAKRYADLFGNNIEQDFGPLLRLLNTAGFARRNPEGWDITESGAIWVHRVQMLFSLTYIDDLWKHCQETPWPKEIILN